MKYFIPLLVAGLPLFLAACDTQSPSQLGGSPISPNNRISAKTAVDEQREAWIADVFDVEEVRDARSSEPPRSFQVAARAHQYADTRLTLRLNGLLTLQAENEVVRTYWRQVGGPQASILSPTETQTLVSLPDVTKRQTLEFEFVGLGSTGLYDFDSVAVTVLPLPARLTVDLESVQPGENAVLLRLNAPLTESVTYRYRTLDGTAVAGQDFQYEEGEVTFDSAHPQQNVPLVVLSENVAEQKVFYLEVSLPGEPDSATIYRITIGGRPNSSKGTFCGVDGADATVPVVTEFSVRVVDALGQVLSQVAVDLSRADQYESPSERFYTDSSGVFVVPCLGTGAYDLAIEAEQGSEVIILQVSSSSQGGQALASFPVRRLDSGELKRLDEDGAIISLSGRVSDTSGAAVVGAQVEVSAGVQTNGAIAVATADENGHYTLLLNVGIAVSPSLASSQIRVVAPGYQPFVLADLNLLDVQAWTGMMFVLEERIEGDAVYYSERFDGPAQQDQCGTWRTSGETSTVEDVVSLWHLHESGMAIRNQAYLKELVTLAPDDTSEGYLPDPVNGAACWYGDHRPSDFTQGNFLGNFADAATSGETTGLLDGGTSLTANEGSLTSPVIDLSSVQSPLSLTFLTWWEIESVNPNDNGYDLMSIEVKEESAQEWMTLARLNPFSDPVGNDDLVHLPYSNRGFNRAPAWLNQEPISLDAYAGKRIQIRLVFNTIDNQFNGFRGWLVDEIKVTNTPGTFPLWDFE